MTHPWCFFTMTMVTLQVSIMMYIEDGDILDLLTLIVLGGGGGHITPCSAKFKRKKCPCSHNLNTALIKQIPLFNTL